MMPIHQAYIPVLAAAAAEVIVSMLWYSDTLFGPTWKKLAGKSSSPKDFYQAVGIHFISSIITATALYIAIVVFQKTQMGVYTQQGLGQMFALFLHDSTSNNTLLCSMKIAGFLWLGFYAPSAVTCAVWVSGNWKKLLIETGGSLAGLVSMAAMIASLS